MRAADLPDITFAQLRSGAIARASCSFPSFPELLQSGIFVQLLPASSIEIQVKASLTNEFARDYGSPG